jgi:hypothetical protein
MTSPPPYDGCTPPPTNRGDSEPAPPARSVGRGAAVKRWRTIRNRLLWLFPNWKALNGRSRAFDQSHDAAENEGTCVPPDLELRVLTVTHLLNANELHTKRQVRCTLTPDKLHTCAKFIAHAHQSAQQRQLDQLFWHCAVNEFG